MTFKFGILRRYEKIIVTSNDICINCDEMNFQLILKLIKIYTYNYFIFIYVINLSE